MPSHYDIKAPRLAFEYWELGAEDQHYCNAVEMCGGKAPRCYTVTHRSPKSVRKAVEVIATYFRREFNYDFVQYSAEHCQESTLAYLWTANGWLGEGNVVIGACAFYWEEWTNVQPCWCLGWVWFHPYERRSGNLTKAWPFFRARFGEFWVSQPLSGAMEAFLTKQGQTPEWWDEWRRKHAKDGGD